MRCICIASCTHVREMDGLPVTVRLLDPPLHEFLPHSVEDMQVICFWCVAYVVFCLVWSTSLKSSGLVSSCLVLSCLLQSIVTEPNRPAKGHINQERPKANVGEKNYLQYLPSSNRSCFCASRVFFVSRLWPTPSVSLCRLFKIE